MAQVAVGRLGQRLLDAVIARDIDGVDPVHRVGHRGPVRGQQDLAAGGPAVERLRLSEQRPRGAGRQRAEELREVDLLQPHQLQDVVRQLPVRRGEPGWAFVVVHTLSTDGPVPIEGEQVTLAVDAAHRAALSAGHTGCHVAALALNAALAGRWRKSVSTDGLGHPDFDQLAIVSSRIVPHGAVDRYRLGRSLRKKGFDVEGLADELPAITAAANHTLTGWVALGAPIDLLVSGPRLTDLREWVCSLPEGTQRIPCGGTHLRSLADVAGIGVELRYDEIGDRAGGELTMTTAVRGG